MSRNNPNTTPASIPAALQPSTLRAGLTLAVVAAFAAYAVRVHAQAPAPIQQNAGLTGNTTHDDRPAAARLTFGF